MFLNPYRFASKKSSALMVPVNHTDRVRLFLTSDMTTYSVLSTKPNEGLVMKFSPDGSLFVVGNGAMAEKFHIWSTGKSTNAATWTKLPAPVSMPSGTIKDAEFSPDGQYLAVAIAGGQVVMIYKTSDWTTLAALNPVPYDAYSISWNSDGSKLAVVGVLTTAVYNIPALTRVGNIAQLSREVAFHPTENNFVAGLGTTPFVRAYSDALVALTPALVAASGNPFDGDSIQFADNGNKLFVNAAGTLTPAEKPLTIYDWSTKQILAQPTLSFNSGLFGMSVTADQKTVAVRGASGVSIVSVDTLSEVSFFIPALFTTGMIAYSPY